MTVKVLTITYNLILMFFLDGNNPRRLWIHLHGFASDVLGSKVEFLRNRFRKGKEFSFFAMDMNYEAHTTTEVLDLLEALVRGFSARYEHIALGGSSHGAYVVANYLRFRDVGNVKSLFLFAPSFRTLDLIVRELGEDRTRKWLEGKERLRFVEEGTEIEVREDFATDILENGYEILREGEVFFPQDSPVRIFIVHGTKDEVVPIEDSRLFVQKVRVEKFVEVDDDHRLSESFGRVVAKLFEEEVG